MTRSNTNCKSSIYHYQGCINSSKDELDPGDVCTKISSPLISNNIWKTPLILLKQMGKEEKGENTAEAIE